jgi:hypothetical protein
MLDPRYSMLNATASQGDAENEENPFGTKPNGFSQSRGEMAEI